MQGSREKPQIDQQNGSSNLADADCANSPMPLLDIAALEIIFSTLDYPVPEFVAIVTQI